MKSLILYLFLSAPVVLKAHPRPEPRVLNMTHTFDADTFLLDVPAGEWRVMFLCNDANYVVDSNFSVKGPKLVPMQIHHELGVECGDIIDFIRVDK